MSVSTLENHNSGVDADPVCSTPHRTDSAVNAASYADDVHSQMSIAETTSTQCANSEHTQVELDKRVFCALPVKKSGEVGNESLFAPYQQTLPCRVTAIVTERLNEHTYRMRDAALINDLHELITRPTRQLSVEELTVPSGNVPCIARLARVVTPKPWHSSRCRLYRGLVTGVDDTRQSCSVHLVDYGQLATCSIGAVFHITEQSYEVQRMQCASLVVRIKEPNVRRRGHPRIATLTEEQEYSIRLTSQCEDGSFHGHCNKERGRRGRREPAGDPRRQPTTNRWSAPETVTTKPPKVTKTAKTERDEKIRLRQEALNEEATSLRRELEMFETKKSKQEQDIALMTLQLQIAHVARMLDALTPNSPLGLGCYPQVGASLPVGYHPTRPMEQKAPVTNWFDAHGDAMREKALDEQKGAAGGFHSTTPCSVPVVPFVPSVPPPPIRVPHSSYGQYSVPHSSYGQYSVPPSVPRSVVYSSPTSGIDSVIQPISPTDSTVTEKPSGCGQEWSRAKSVWNGLRNEKTTWKSTDVSVCSPCCPGESIALGQPSVREQASSSTPSGYSSIAYANRMLNRFSRFGLAYGEPPKHLLSEFESVCSNKHHQDPHLTNNECTLNEYRKRSLDAVPCAQSEGEVHLTNRCSPNRMSSRAAGDHAGIRVQEKGCTPPEAALKSSIN